MVIVCLLSQEMYLKLDLSFEVRLIHWLYIQPSSSSDVI